MQPGTKRPYRIFYVPLAIPFSESSPDPVAECSFAYPVGRARIPLHMKLHPVPGRVDCGHTGIWNQNEFCLKLISLQPASSWNVAECTYNQWSFCGVSVTGIAENLGQPGQVLPTPASASAPAGAEADQVDYSLFDDSFLSRQGAASSFMDMAMGMATGAGFEQPVFADNEEDDLSKDEDGFFLDPDILSDHEMLDSSELPKSDDDKPLHSSEPSKGSRETHTTSTDTDLLRATLGTRCLGNYVCCLRINDKQRIFFSYKSCSNACVNMSISLDIPLAPTCFVSMFSAMQDKHPRFDSPVRKV